MNRHEQMREAAWSQCCVPWYSLQDVSDAAEAQERFGDDELEKELVEK